MSERIIEIDPLDPSSIIRARRETERWLQEFDKKVERFLAEIAKLGAETAQAAYGNGATVTVEPTGDGYLIRADGRGVVFLEFGAGDAVAVDNKYAGEMPFGVYPGSWSEQHKRQYSETGKWTFGGVEYTEIQPRNGMQKADDAIRSKWRSIARSVFT